MLVICDPNATFGRGIKGKLSFVLEAHEKKIDLNDSLDSICDSMNKYCKIDPNGATQVKLDTDELLLSNTLQLGNMCLGVCECESCTLTDLGRLGELFLTLDVNGSSDVFLKENKAPSI